MGSHRRIPSLMGTTALVSAALAITAPANAQDYGLLWDGPGQLIYTNAGGDTLEGNNNGVLGRDGSVALTNAGVVRGLFGNAIVLQQADSSLSNSGLVEGAGFGLTTNSWFNPETGLNEGRAIGTIVDNSGTIRGLSNDGVRLIGGGTVTNSGVIEGLATGGADGVSMFTHGGQDVSGFTSVGTVTNLVGGTIFGNRFGIILSTGGTVDNAGSISGNVGGVAIQDGVNDGSKIGTVTNSGSIGGGTGVSFGVNLASSSLTNSGSITATLDDGILNSGANIVAIDNQAGGSITGALKGIHAAEGAVIVTNAGTIRGNGTYDGFQATPDGGISIAAGGSSITNSGSISGARFGITTYNYYNAQTGLLEPRATGTTVTNLAGGSIIGDGDDGVRLIGGGTVTNAGVIEGRNFLRAEGVSMFALEGQDTSGQTGMGTVTNLAGGTIIGNRFGIGLSGGGNVENAGTILGSDFSTGSVDGFGAGILFQATANEPGKIGTLGNSGSIAGGHGVLFGGFLAGGEISNSGSITGTQMAGVINTAGGTVSIDNMAGGTITGAQSGVIARVGAIALTNAGTVTGSGGGNNGGVLIERDGVSITNSGLIEGTRFGVVANPSGSQPWTTATIVDNSGTIRGLNNDGMRLVGGGTVTNTGLIEGVADPFGFATDGISMFSFTGQDVSGISSIGTVNNLAGGTINGQRSGIILSTGGTVNNAGSIWAPDFTPVSFDGFATGIILQDGTNSGGKIGTITNSGSISAGVGIAFSGGLASGFVSNSGMIEGRAGDGLINRGSAVASIDNQAGGSITGALRGIYAADAAVIVTNAGSITGNGGGQAGIQIEQAGSSVSNSGTITGANFGITTASYTNAAGVSEGRAIGTIVSNSGTIRGQNNDGVRLIGGGTVTNSGLIEGLNSIGSDGVSMFRFDDQDVSGITSIGTVTNLAGGTIFGNRLGIILSTGGVVDNAGSISGNVGGVTIQDGLNDGGKTGTLINIGSISGGEAVGFYGALASASLTNSGSITGTASDGIANYSTGPLTIDNQAGGSIVGALKGIHAAEGAVIVTNAGSIRGNGTANSVLDRGGGIIIAASGSSITNSGSISGAGHGIGSMPQSGAVDTAVINLAGGTIIGDANDGVGLSGGGSVTNAGLIEGRGFALADGIQMSSPEGQDNGGQTSFGTITNLAGGTIIGVKYGVYAIGGIEVNNAGTILGPDFRFQSGTTLGTGVYLLGGDQYLGTIGTVMNSGSISGGNGIVFSASSGLASGLLSNSGGITGTQSDGVYNQGANAIVIDNMASGSITGARSGIYGEFGAITVTNAGTIRGNGINSSFNRTDAGVVMVQAGSSVANSGTISGAAFGITTAAYAIDAQGRTSGRAIDTVVTNSGTIRGDSNDGVRLVGGGTVTNSGLIEGLNSPGSDGVSMFRYDDQDVSARPSIGSVINQAGGEIFGDRFGIILSGGGLIENDGTIRGNASGLLIQAGNALAPYTGTLINRGTIQNGARFNDGLVASVTNSGTISIDHPDTAALESLAEISVVNTGTITSTGTHAIRFGIGNDLLTLGTGSSIIGISDGGAGLDTLRLESGAGVSQALGRFDGFESLEALSGTWTVAGDTGTFDTISIAGGKLVVTGAIAGNVATSGPGTFQLGEGGSVGGFTGDIVNDGQLIVDIGTDFDIGGDFSGTGSFTKDGAGTVSFLGAYAFTGTTTLLAGGIRIAGALDPEASFELGGGTLDLSDSTGTTIAGLSGDAGSSVILGASNLTVNQDIDTLFAGSLSGTGSLIKDGDGRLNLTGISTYTGPTIVSGGTLSVNGSIVSPVTIQSGATLGGTGTTGTVTIETGGTFNPGNSIGTIRVVGPLSFRSGSTFAVETSPTGASDRINVTGRVTIDAGASMSVLAGTGNYRPSTTYIVLTATDRVVGRFGSVSSDLAFLEPKLDYSSKKVELTLKRRNISFASVASTTNQAAVAQAVETMGLNSALYDGVLNQNIAGARAAYDALSGGFFGDISNRLLVNGTRVQESLQDHAPLAEAGISMWTAVESGTRKASGPEYRSGFSVARDGIQLSIVSGYIPFERVAFGSGGHANMETHYSGGAVGYALDGLRLQAGIGFGWHDIRASRNIAFSGFSDQAETRYRLQTRQLFADVSYTHAMGALELSPFASLSSLHQSHGQIEEAPSAAALNIYAQDRDLMLASTGVRAGTRIELGSQLSLTPRVTLGWQWARGDLDALQQTRFATSGAAFVIAGDSLARSGVDVNAGMQLDAGRFSLTAGYRRNALLNGLDDGAELGLLVRF